MTHAALQAEFRAARQDEAENWAVPRPAHLAVVIPTYRVRSHVIAVIERIGPEVGTIYVVDDACPDQSGKHVEESVTDGRVRVIYNATNQGVGGATIAGMRKAVEDGAQFVVKIDGDGQMDPGLVLNFIRPIMIGEADYTKGNRFFEPEGLVSMPLSRLIGNAGLSFLAKISTGYWHSFDPTNGYFAIHGDIIKILPLDKLAKRYFFESDLLFRLNIIGARVADVPMFAYYGDETSSMQPLRELLRFGKSHIRNFAKRIFYNYFLRNFSLASVELVLGLGFLLFGIAYGIFNWGTEREASAGTVMLSALPVMLGMQLLLAFFNYDIQSVPRSTLHLRLRTSGQLGRALRHRDGTGNTRR